MASKRTELYIIFYLLSINEVSHTVVLLLP